MTLKYSLIGVDNQSSTNLISQLSRMEGLELAGNSEDSQKLLDIVLANTPSLIFINVDKYTTNDFLNLKNIISDLYRSFLQKPYLVALASSGKQAYDCLKNDFYDYLIHPVTGQQFQKLEYKLRTSSIPVRENPQKLCLRTYSDYRFVEIKDIIFLKADNNTTELVMLDNAKITAYKTLKHFESVLPKSFKRIHQSFIINQNYVSRIHLGRSECHLNPLKMRLPFSKSYKKVVAELANTLSSNALT